MVKRNWLFNDIDFSTYPDYKGDDLGVFWSPAKTVFRIWAPVAKIVELRLYNNSKKGEHYFKTQLLKSDRGIWSVELNGDYEGKFYTFKINDGSWLNEVPDIYARCVGINGKRGMIFDPEKTDPSDWESDKGPRYKSFTEAIIYETHIRDFSISELSGIKNKGKYLGFTEDNTKNPDGFSTGISHLKELGITHVHLLPVYDFHTIDEEFPDEKYNWGYDPQNYNSPEGSYSSDPYDGTIRIKEFKELVKACHQSGIGVIMDVVYNHTGKTKSGVFNQIIPGYFYRQNHDGSFANASGCGNEIASERFMVRKYILDSLKYWATEYHIDGFRFDLMGIHDLETMSEIRKEMDKIDTGIFLYGEGWAAGPSPMQEGKRAVKNNISKLSGIATFSDDMRDALKGSWGDEKSKGFVSGLTLSEESVKFGIVGSVHHPQIIYDYINAISWANEPDQCINYVSCHDNYTLWDKLKLSNADVENKELKKMAKLAGAIILTSQGVPFLHSGIEFCRTKGGNGNSYKSPDSVNQIDWGRKSDYHEVFEYYQKLIELRKNHIAFRMPKSEQIRQNLKFHSDYKPGVISYTIDGNAVGDNWSTIIVIFNNQNEEITVSVPEDDYLLIAEGAELNEKGLRQIITGTVKVQPVSMTILVNFQ